jgi:hypothetical protein
MKFVKTILKALAVLVVLFIGVAFLLPSHVSVSRSLTIFAPDSAVFPYVNSMKATQKWSPWLERDPNVVVKFEGPDKGVGARMQWSSQQRDVGNGTQVITASLDNQRVESALDFGSQGQAIAFFDLVENGADVEVTWGFSTDLGMNPIARWMGLMFDKMIGGDYELGLAKLKTLVEAQ